MCSTSCHIAPQCFVIPYPSRTEEKGRKEQKVEEKEWSKEQEGKFQATTTASIFYLGATPKKYKQEHSKAMTPVFEQSYPVLNDIKHWLNDLTIKKSAPKVKKAKKAK